MNETLPAWIEPAVSEVLGKQVRRIRRVKGREGGYSSAIRRVAELADSSSAFLKIGTTPALMRWLRHEIKMYEAVNEPFMLVKLGHVDDREGVVLILENAEQAIWPPPWTNGQIDDVLALLERLRCVRGPEWLFWLQGPGGLVTAQAGWDLVAQDPRGFLSLGVVSRGWLERNLEHLLALSDLRYLDGGAFVHLDVRSDNLCFVEDSVRLIDWSAARLGHPYIDQHYWATTLLGETGRRYPQMLTAGAVNHFVMLAGYYAGVADGAQATQASEARVRRAADAVHALLPWACELAHIEAPDGSIR